MDKQMISVKGLCKEFYIRRRRRGFWGGLRSFFSSDYDVKKALDGISFEVEKGELIGYIGPNGSGKSTTVKTLSGILVPTNGEVQVMGKIPWKNRIETVRNLGVVFGQRTQLWWDLPVIDTFLLLKDIYKIPDKTYRNNLDALEQKLELSKIENIPVRQLSLGQRMRCDIAASLLHSPKILFLDEPTIGLDAVGKLAVRDFIKHLNEEHKVTIMLTTHDMDDIEALCNRVIVLNEGSIFFDGTLNGLRKKISPERILIVDLLNENDTIVDAQTELIRQEGHRVVLSFNPNVVSAPELISRIVSKHDIRDLYVENPPIEKIIAKFYMG